MRISLLAVRFDWLNKLHLHICRKNNTAHNLWPQLKRRSCDERRIKRDIIKVVMKISAAATMSRVTCHSHSGPTLAPMADPADIVAG